MESRVQLILPAEYKYLNVLGASIAAMLEHAPHIDEMDVIRYNIQLAAQEVCTNIIEHAYADEAQKGAIRVLLTFEADPLRLRIVMRDAGEPFNMGGVSQPMLDAPQVKGYGLFLVHQLMDEVVYQPEPGNNRWYLTKYLAKSEVASLEGLSDVA